MIRVTHTLNVDTIQAVPVVVVPARLVDGAWARVTDGVVLTVQPRAGLRCAAGSIRGGHGLTVTERWVLVARTVEDTATCVRAGTQAEEKAALHGGELSEGSGPAIDAADLLEGPRRWL